MPSLRSLLSTLTLTSQLVLGGELQSHYSGRRLNTFDLTASESCPHPQLSCHNSTVVKNLCCFNAPGGSLLQTQFWDTDPPSGPSDSWTIHGLWPDNCDGTYSANCAPQRAYHNISAILKAAGKTQLLDYMNQYWTSNEGPAASFWAHEWDKHGTCISTLDPQCYAHYEPTEEVPDFFQATVDLFKTLPTYAWLADAGITPSSSKTYSRSKIQAALSKKHGDQVYLGCYNGQLDEVWYFFNVKGSVQTGEFVAAPPVGATSSCPETGIKYLPKSGSGGGGGGSSGTATSTGSTPKPTGPTFSGKGYLNVITGGKKEGCIISYGTWYMTGTCATFYVSSASSASSSSSDGEFTLESSKGKCAIASGKLTCSSDVTEASIFDATGDMLVYEGEQDFYADAVPSGSEQATVFTGADGHSVGLEIQWESV